MAKILPALPFPGIGDMLSITNVLGVSGRVVMSPPLKLKDCNYQWLKDEIEYWLRIVQRYVFKISHSFNVTFNYFN